MAKTTEQAAKDDVTGAIARSISHNEIAHLPWTQERQDALLALADEEGGDSVDTGDVVEAWGVPGNGWRVHLDRADRDADAQA